MGETVIRPSTRLVRLAYLFILGVAAVVLWILSGNPGTPAWPLVIPMVAMLFPLKRHIELQFTRLIVTGDGHLRHESGVLSKSERSVRLDKVQDVAITQTSGQRMLGLGDIAVETAGGTSRIEMKNVDNPRAIRDQILAASKVSPHEP